MNLGIDVRPLAYGITGNSRYLAETLQILIPRFPNIKFTFFSNKPIHPVFSDLLKHSNIILVIETRKIPGPFYLHFILPRRITQQKVDSFWATLQLLPFRKLKIPSFVNYHDLNFISAPETMAKWNYFQHKLFSPHTLKNADRIFCLSQNTQNEIGNHFPKQISKCVVIYPGVIRRKFKRENRNFPPNFYLTIGTLEPRKNLQTLINAFINFKSLHPNDNHSLLILGRKGWGTEGDELYLYLQSNESKNNHIFFFENPSDDTLGQAIQDCEAFFFPSLHEGFGLPLLEAMIENKRCVASDIPVFKEILEEKNDLYVSASSEKAWENAFHSASQFLTTERSPKFNEENWTWNKTADLLQKELFK